MKVIHTPVVDAEIAKFKAGGLVDAPRRRSWLLCFVEWLAGPMPKMPKAAPRIPQSPPLRVIDPPLPFDPSAFWLYPDWDGPLNEPFWMRPMLQPESHCISGARPMTYAFSRRVHQTGITFYFDERGRQIGAIKQ